jgi:DNA-binding SARP family transcriptional activator
VSREKLLALLWPDADDERGPRTLAQALYALRRDLAADDAIVGAKDLRLDPALVSSDVSEFASALARGDDARAVGLYHGPFLDGFHVPGADEFARWADRERATLAAEYSRALESLARAARAAGDPRTAVDWWRKLAAIEPLNARVTVGLMDALAAAGDRGGAIQHARVYELLVEQELDLPPDKEVLAFADRLRQSAGEASPSPSVPISVSAPTLATPEPVLAPAANRDSEPASQSPPARDTAAPETTPRPAPLTKVRQRWRPATIAALSVAVIAAVVISVRSYSRAHLDSAPSGEPVVAIGNITAYGTDSAPAALTAPVADLLTTSLARVRTIRVVSHGRMLELLHGSGGGDTSTGAFVDAARRAGATELIDGTLYARVGGRLRLDLRRVDLATGAIGDVHTIEGADLFALVDSGTTRLLTALGAATPAGSVADVTTRSVTAYRMYEQGIHAYYLGDTHTALGFFDSALGEDSLFALAAYYSALSDPVPESYVAKMERARRLATRATDRERLTILAGWSHATSSPSARPIAETLATRYPAELEGHLYSGIARVFEGDFLGGLGPLQRVVTMDSLGLRGARASCAGCDALRWIVSGYELADSMPAAVREARRWLRLQPKSMTAAYALIQALEFQYHDDEADSVFHAVAPRDLAYAEVVGYETGSLIHAGRYAAADSMLREQLRQPGAREQESALWSLSLSLREQGRLTEALNAARGSPTPSARAAPRRSWPTPISVMEAQLLLESGNSRAAAVLFDSLSRQHGVGAVPSQLARGTAWMLAQVAGARFAAGDTGSLGQLADSVRLLGEASDYGRDRRLHHYVRGLLIAARGDDAAAASELESAIYSTTLGFTRANYELGRVFMRLRRPRDAARVVGPALRGPVESSNLYVNRVQLHELLAQAWDAAGARDSAIAHYGVVARAWSNGDPPFKARADRCRDRAAELARGGTVATPR